MNCSLRPRCVRTRPHLSASTSHPASFSTKLAPREKFEPTATAEDIVKLEAEIKVLEEQNKKLLSGSVGSILDL
ncbi:hypothetical protein BC830DRAFT_1095722 [Chytriomyces sp. MP71]|nr:hypothetical protein BC830DRAFT_1095722 [Chytriomyces sp. MP71]